MLIITFHIFKHLEKYKIQANGHANGQSNGHSNGLNGHTIVEDSESESEAEEVSDTHRKLTLRKDQWINNTAKPILSSPLIGGASISLPGIASCQ